MNQRDLSCIARWRMLLMNPLTATFFGVENLLLVYVTMNKKKALYGKSSKVSDMKISCPFSIKPTVCLIILMAISQNMKAQSQIEGQVTNTSGMPLPFANVVCYPTSTDSDPLGTVSDSDGKYKLENIPAGSYTLEISLVGYETLTQERLELFVPTKELNFILKPATEILDEVVVKGNPPVLRQTAEKLILNVQNSEMINTNLQDVMKKIPGMIVVNGRINYGGQQNIRILINGKRTDYMDTETLLRDFPADQIKEVVLIQQPGAEFDAEGTGPIVNIILMKNAKLGSFGTIKTNLGYDNQPEYGTNVSYSSYKGQLNWQGQLGARQSSWREDLFLNRKVGDKVYYNASISPYRPVTYQSNLNLDYYGKKGHSLGVSGRVIQTQSNRTTANETQIGQSNATDLLLTDNIFERDRTTFTLNPYYEYEDEQQKLIVDFNYVYYQNSNDNEILRLTGSNLPYTNQRYEQLGDYTIRTYRLDYKRDLTEKTQWQSGFKGALVNTDNRQEVFDDTATGYKNNTALSNAFLIDESILAVYTKLNHKWEKGSLSAGLRWEESVTEGFSRAVNETRSRKISRLFPSASVQQTIKGPVAASLAYSYRINRPAYNSLNAFTYYYDPYTAEQGNPNLKPAFSNNYQFNLTYDNQPFFGVSYRQIQDNLFEIVTQNDASAQAARTTINLGAHRNWRMQLFAPLNFGNSFEGFTGVIANHNAYQSENLEPILNLARWNFAWFTSVEWRLPGDIQSEISFFYSNGGLEGIIDYDYIIDLSTGFSKSFLADQLKVNLSISDWFNRQFIGRIRYANVDTEVISDWYRRIVNLQFTYKIGQQYGRSRKRDNSAADEQNRIKDNN